MKIDILPNDLEPEGVIRSTLQQVKREGKTSQSIRDFLNGNQKFMGFVMP